LEGSGSNSNQITSIKLKGSVIIGTAFFSSDLSTRSQRLLGYDPLPFNIPQDTKIACHLQHFVLYCLNPDKPALLPNGARRTGQNQEMLGAFVARKQSLFDIRYFN
jgi:hypothetical protein